MKGLALVLALAFLVLAILAGTGMANVHSHALGVDGTHHLKHTVLYVILAVLSLVWMRFQSGSTSDIG